MKFQIIDVSCYRRRLELEQVKNYFDGNGAEYITEDFEVDPDADTIIISTCGFTQAAEDFGLKTIERVEAERKPGSNIIVGGCLSKINPEAVDSYNTFDPRSYEKLDDYTDFDNKFSTFKRPNVLRDWKIHTAFRENGLMQPEEGSLDIAGQKTREENIKNATEINEKVVKNLENNEESFRIQCVEGCACKCSYCAIKFAIGKSTSRPIDVLMEEVREGIQNGYKKIYLEGDSLGGYGLDIKSNFGELLDHIIEEIRDKDIELNITDVSPMFLKYCYEQIIELGKLKKIFNFYIPVQSGSQQVLNGMKRGYDIDKTKDLILKIKEETNVDIGTSIIIGFPGETAEDLEKTIQLCKDIKFDYVFVHNFSARKGTEAYELTNKIAADDILIRSRYFKNCIKDYTDLITIAEDTKGNRTCQG